MAEGLLKSFDENLEVFSAGTHPAPRVALLAIQVMKEIGINISHNYPKDVNLFIEQPFDFVITVCGNAKETCPVFVGKVGSHIHIGFEDPAEAQGSEDDVLNTFRRIRDEIKTGFYEFYINNIKEGIIS